MDRERKRRRREALYYEVDSALNSLMLRAEEAEAAEARLSEAKLELRTAKDKYVFLCETGYANRVLARGFQQAAHERYQRAIARRRAVEETVRNARAGRAEAERRYGEARARFIEGEGEEE